MEEVEPGTAQGKGRQKPGGTTEKDTQMRERRTSEGLTSLAMRQRKGTA